MTYITLAEMSFYSPNLSNFSLNLQADCLSSPALNTALRACLNVKVVVDSCHEAAVTTETHCWQNALAQFVQQMLLWA